MIVWYNDKYRASHNVTTYNEGMDGMESKKSNHLRLHYVLSYLFMLFIPFTIYIFTFTSATDLIREHIKTSHLMALEQSQSLVDDQLGQIASLSLQLSNDTVFRHLFSLQGDIPTSSYYDFESAILHFTNYLQNKELIVQSSCYIYLYGIDRVLLPDTLYPAEVYHNFALGFPGDKYGQWQALLTQTYLNGTILSSEDYGSEAFYQNNIVWARSLPQKYLKKPAATLVVHIDKDTLSSFFTNTKDGADTVAYIEDENGLLVSVISGGEQAIEYHNNITFQDDNDFFSERVNGQKLLVSYTVSDENGWRYVSVVPEDAVLGRLNGFRRLSILAIIGASLIGLAMAFTLANRNAKPILRISEKLHELLPDETGGPLDLIEGGISRLAEDNQALVDDLNRHRPFLQHNLINCLFSGHCATEEELANLSAYTDVRLDFTGFLAMIIRFDIADTQSLSPTEIRNISILKILLRNTMEKVLPMRKLWNEPDYKTAGVLLEVGELTAEGRAELTDQLTLALEHSVKQSQCGIYFALGEPCKDPLNIWRSVDQAMQALEYAGAGKTVVWYRDLNHEGDSYYYPLEVEQRLINFAKAGDNAQIDKLLDTIAEENLTSRTLSLYASKELSGEMRSTLRRLLINHPELAHLSDKLKELKCTCFDDGLIRSIHRIYSEICEMVRRTKKSTNDELIERIQAYIRQHYADSDLGLYKIASHFNLSEGYFSYYFKEASGVNFTEYLEKTRLSNAEKLLKDGGMNMDQIAEAVGYNSAQSFRRAFKKVYGISPNAMRAER